MINYGFRDITQRVLSVGRRFGTRPFHLLGRSDKRYIFDNFDPEDGNDRVVRNVGQQRFGHLDPEHGTD